MCTLQILWRRERLPTPGFWPREFHVYGVAKSQTQLSDFHFTCTLAHKLVNVLNTMLNKCVLS